MAAFSTPLSAHTTEKSTSSDGGHYSGVPFDASVVNEDRLIKALKKQGKIKRMPMKQKPKSTKELSKEKKNLL
ncbi:hypothetical protein ACEQPO_29240 [Bacillus sp. SL00103]